MGSVPVLLHGRAPAWCMACFGTRRDEQHVLRGTRSACCFLGNTCCALPPRCMIYMVHGAWRNLPNLHPLHAVGLKCCAMHACYVGRTHGVVYAAWQGMHGTRWS